MPRVFIAYPSKPELTEVMRQVQEKKTPGLDVITWERPDLGGNQLIAPIITAIKDCDFVAADITQLNFNVTYELAFAFGLGKRVIPIRYSAYNMDNDAIQMIGIFDTLIRQEYRDSDELASLLHTASGGQRIATNFPPDPSPLYVILPTFKVGGLAQIKERALRTGLRSRVFDPDETPRLGASEAVRAVAASTGVIVPLISPDVREASIHNIRAAFVSGVAHALEKQTLIIQHGRWPVPLDVRDYIESYQDDPQLGSLISSFAGRVHDILFSSPIAAPATDNLLSGLNLGDPAAENEEAQLEAYFLERGENKQVLDQRANIVVGRKGSGKTAVFVIVRDQLRATRSNVVLDLSPETHQLKRLKDLVLNCLAAGSKEFLLSGFWEYVLMLEIAQKLLEKDADVHKRNHTLFEPYQLLLAVFRAETPNVGVDFSDRLQMLIDRIVNLYIAVFGAGEENTLSQAQVTNLLYKTTLAQLRNSIETYAKHKKGIYVLFDNLDKGWNASGIEKADIAIIRTLLDAGRKLENDFRRAGVDFHVTVFLRNDVYEMLLSETADRGKGTRVLVDWAQMPLLKQIVRRRLRYALGTSKDLSVEALWHRICVPVVEHENSLDYLVRRSLMRPRYLLRLINYCKGNAINFSRNKIDEEDIRIGLSEYSTDIVKEIDLEIRDLLGNTGDVLYAFLGEPRRMKLSSIRGLIAARVPDENVREGVYTLLLWHGVLGLLRSDLPDATYIYDVNYDMKRLLGLIQKFEEGDPQLEINPGFWAGLELTA